ncbi:Mg-dependent DNase [Epithele typhae]|uniref:Mg-dependent DNase n=1 Tax=Epithele typhae TaxID=378194 RepID=UPI002007C6F3|nr:Mg-dependent DNase [Epithele typhae]KAH9944205.1 Mg-dependent DNase [Epithele typhae]
MPVTVITAKPQDSTHSPQTYRFIDPHLLVSVNLTDPVFRGLYHGRQKHDDDLEAMLERCRAARVQSMIITGTSLHESKEALKLAKQLGFYATVGCHPTRSAEFDKFRGGPGKYLEELDNLIAANLTGPGRVVAIGECGLDYDRLHFAKEDVQRRHFRAQLALAKKYHLPLFLHSRAAHADFVSILREEGFDKDGGSAAGGKGGVVHSFTGTPEEAIEVMDMGLHVSVNGCSLKTAENLATAKAIRPDKIMFETDAPWCTMTSTHASRAHLSSLSSSLNSVYFPQGTKPESFVYGRPVKGRNEPSAVGGVAWVIHKLNDGVPFEKVVEKGWKNTIELFGLTELQ